MKLFIQTLGCAMNERDSAHMIAELRDKKHYTLTNDIKQADLILINTCSVREKPEKKLFSEKKKQGQKSVFVVAQPVIWVRKLSKKLQV